jgi:hypothetical protein
MRGRSDDGVSTHLLLLQRDYARYVTQPSGCSRENLKSHQLQLVSDSSPTAPTVSTATTVPLASPLPLPVYEVSLKCV